MSGDEDLKFNSLDCDLHTFIHKNWRRQWHPTLVLLPGKSHGRRSLVGYSPWGHEESDMTELLHDDTILIHIIFSKDGPVSVP